MNYNQQYYQENKEIIKLRAKVFYAANRDRIREVKHQKYLANPKSAKQRCQKWRAENPHKKLLADRAWKARNPVKVLESRRKRAKKMTEYMRTYESSRRKVDPGYKIRKNLSVRLRIALKSVGARKRYSMSDFLGCSLEHFKAWLKFWMQPGMTWENYGYDGWHIDHKRPCASFDLTKLEQQKQCFHYTNLQPLWKDENFRKGDKCSV